MVGRWFYCSQLLLVAVTAAAPGQPQPEGNLMHRIHSNSHILILILFCYSTVLAVVDVVAV